MKARLFLFTVLFTGLAVSVLAQDQPRTKKAGKTKPAPAADAPLPEGVKEFTYKRTPQGEVTMFTRRLDLNGLLKEIKATESAPNVDEGPRDL